MSVDQAKEPFELSAEVVRYTPDKGLTVRFLDLDAGMLPILARGSSSYKGALGETRLG